MMRKVSTTCLWLPLLLLCGSIGAAQERASVSDQVALERFVLTYWTDLSYRNDPAGRAAAFADVAIDPRLQTRRVSFGWHPSEPSPRTAAESAELARILGSGLVLPEEDSCTNHDCRRAGHRGMIAFTAAIIQGDSAEIDFHTRIMSSRVPSSSLNAIERWTLVRDGRGGWRLVDRKTLAIT